MIDCNTFNALKERMKAKFPVLLEGYIKDSKEYIASIEANFPDGDLNIITGAAHNLKSSSALMGLHNVSKAAESLEHTGKDMLENGIADHAFFRSQYEALHNAFADVENDLQNELINAKQV